MRQSLDSGARIGIVDKNGERGFMSDEQRAAESQTNQGTGGLQINAHFHAQTQRLRLPGLISHAGRHYGRQIQQ